MPIRDLKLIARSILTSTVPPYGIEKYLFPGGNVLVLLYNLWSSVHGPPDQTLIDVWSIRDPKKPRRLLRTRTKSGWTADTVVLKETEDGAVGRLVLPCVSDAMDGEEYSVDW